METLPAPSNSQIFRGMRLILITVVLFAIQDTISKYLTRYYPASMILWVRYLIHVALFLAIVLPRKGTSAIRTERLPIQLLRGAIMALSALFFTLALKYIPLAEASAIAYISPILVTLLAVLILKEKMEKGLWGALFFSFAGVLILIRPGSDLFTWAAFLPLVNAVTFATYQILTRHLSGLESPYSLMFYPGLMGLLMYSFSLPSTWVTPENAWHIFLLIALGVLAVSSQILMIKAFEIAPASRLAPFGYTQLIWTTLFGYLFFGDFPDQWSLAGIGILIVSGIYCANHQRLSGKEARRILSDPPPKD